MNAVQDLLEQACFEWAKKWTPDVLKERKWSCAEAVKLGQWAKVLPRRFSQISKEATSLDSGNSLKGVLLSTHSLRHAAVHRLPTSAKGVEKMLNNALHLLKALHDTSNSFKLEALLNDFRSKV